ncbi:MAG: EscU/YscU/HrcU family type III secretion system export apparatus switch protein [Polyangiales bacterium]
MSEQDKAQQTEDATPKKKEQLRDDGKLVKSEDLVSAAVLLCACAAIAITIGGSSAKIASIARRAFRLRGSDSPLEFVGVATSTFMNAAFPVIFAAMVGAIVIGLTQSRFYFSFKDLAPKAERFAPLANVKKMLPGKESAIEIVKAVAKLGAVGLIVYKVVEGDLSLFIGLGASSVEAGASATLSVAGRIAKWGIVAFLCVAAFDYFMAKRKFEEDAKMSRRDIRDEMKQDQGDPLIKRRQRQRMRELMTVNGNIAEATVLVTNPTHLAVAIRYDPTKDAAPMVLAMAKDDAALNMRREARKNGVPIVENKPFARAMYKDAKVGEVLPAEFFGPAAAIIAHVLGLGGNRVELRP